MPQTRKRTRVLEKSAVTETIQIMKRIKLEPASDGSGDFTKGDQNNNKRTRRSRRLDAKSDNTVSAKDDTKKKVVKVETPASREDTEEDADFMKCQIKPEPVKSEPLDNSSTAPSTESNGEDEGLCDYEKKLLENRKANEAFLAQLGVFQAKESFVEVTKPKRHPSSRGLHEKKKPAEPLPRRASLRIRNMAPDGTELPEKPVLFVATEDEHPRKPEGPIVLHEDIKNVEDTEVHQQFLSSLQAISNNKNTGKPSSSQESFLKSVRKLKMTPERVAKVVPARSFSIAIHPTETKVLAVSGDKWGRLGFWDVENKKGQDGVFSYEPHSRPINCLNFHPQRPGELYSCSYDGTVRCCYFEKGAFDLVYATDEDDDLRTNAFDWTDPNSMLVAMSDGDTIALDLRTPRSVVETYRTHNKSCRTVSVHPTQNQYFLTACYDGRAELWDIRHMSKKKCTSLDVLIHPKTLSSAYFSPITGNNVVTTCMDNKIRLYDSSSVSKDIKLTKAFYHNNHTGRWLTKFRAVWHPAVDDVFVVGSMERPRRIQVYGSSGSLLHEFFDEESLGSVCSVNAFHPTRNIVVGANSSGRLHVFM